MRQAYQLSLTGKTQANGAQVLDTSLAYHSRIHIQVETSAQASAGTLTVAIRLPGAQSFATLGVIDLTACPVVVSFVAIAEAIRFTPTSFDSGKTYSVYVVIGG